MHKNLGGVYKYLRSFFWNEYYAKYFHTAKTVQFIIIL